MTHRVAICRSSFILHSSSFILALCACSSSGGTPVGNIAGPVALAVAQSSSADTGGQVVFIADAGNSGLRAYLPSSRLFVRGPNAVSPLSVPVGPVLASGVVDAFRPTRLAAGTVTDGTSTRGFALVGGGSRRVAVVDAQTFDSATLPVDLPGPVRDVATAKGKSFALTGPGDGSGSALVTLRVSVPSGSLAVAVDSTQTLTGDLAGLAAMSDGSRVWVGDRAAPQVLEIVPGGSVRTIATDGGTDGLPVDRVFVVPAYTTEAGATQAEGALILALLRDGSLLALDPAAGRPARDPVDPSRDIAPLSLATPITDLTFVPCVGSPCTTLLRTSSADPQPRPLVAFVSLGDGTAAALLPDSLHPQVFRPVDTGAATPAASTPGFSDAAAAPGATAPVLAVDATQLTKGVTRTEAFRVVFQGILPGFESRPATLTAPSGAPVLADPVKGLLAAAQPGDRVRVTAVQAPCPALAVPLTLSVASATDDTLTLAAPAPPLPASCGPAQVVYELRAGPQTATGGAPWVVAGTAAGFAGRARTDAAFAVQEPRFFYPSCATSAPPDPACARPGPAVAFTITGPDPSPDAAFAFSTNAALSPLLVSAGDESLATAVAATTDRLYVAVSQLRLSTGSPTAGGVLVEANLSRLTLGDAVSVFR